MTVLGEGLEVDHIEERVCVTMIVVFWNLLGWQCRLMHPVPLWNVLASMVLEDSRLDLAGLLCVGVESRMRTNRPAHKHHPLIYRARGRKRVHAI